MRTATFIALSCLALTTVAPRAADAKYAPPAVTDMLFASELVAIGEIVEVKKKTYTLEIEEILRGGAKVSGRVTIVKKRDWTCSVRAIPYAVGQRIVVLANEAEDESGHFITRSAGHEGELFITDGGEVALGYFFTTSAREIESRVGGKKLSFYGDLVTESTFVDAMRGVDTCFDITIEGSSPYSATVRGERKCAAARHEALATKNALYKLYAEKLSAAK